MRYARALFIVLGYAAAMVISFVVGYFLGGVLL